MNLKKKQTEYKNLSPKRTYCAIIGYKTEEVVMSNQTTTFSVRMDSSVKASLDEFCAAVGMNTNTAINMFARVVTRDKRLPFDVAVDQFNNENNIRYLTALKDDLEAGKIKLTEHELLGIEEDNA